MFPQSEKGERGEGTKPLMVAKGAAGEGETRPGSAVMQSGAHTLGN